MPASYRTALLEATSLSCGLLATGHVDARAADVHRARHTVPAMIPTRAQPRPARPTQRARHIAEKAAMGDSSTLLELPQARHRLTTDLDLQERGPTQHQT